ncbi:hypothetical protein GpartN1_g6271.t1 [Galdieria partita]|uniref:CBF1-interacting co-repressor CIR N-terminal domain-containing protein n=1 Tax=Galdieria partita TaxID=83374 RepID=A0A9C7Q1T8_9RHOD|nr:hypothetical protein GpartN1_g6271.t1 [Galdieria partita]
MNLLPHKSWNIWSSKNIARIERDEAAFEREQREQQLEHIQRQRDSRLEKLRKRVRGEEEKNEGAAADSGGGRVLLFEKEERQAKETKEKKNTSLNNTIKDNLKDSLKVPWYACGRRRKEEVQAIESSKSIQEQDPLKVVQEWEDREKRVERKRKRKENSRDMETMRRDRKRQPSFIRIDKSQLRDKNIWNQLRASPP